MQFPPPFFRVAVDFEVPPSVRAGRAAAVPPSVYERLKAVPSDVRAMLPANCTVAHVFEHLQDLERQAGEEVGLQEYHLEFNFKGPFSSGRREDYFPVIKRALGITSRLRTTRRTPLLLSVTRPPGTTL